MSVNKPAAWDEVLYAEVAGYAVCDSSIPEGGQVVPNAQGSFLSSLISLATKRHKKSQKKQIRFSDSMRPFLVPFCAFLWLNSDSDQQLTDDRRMRAGALLPR